MHTPLLSDAVAKPYVASTASVSTFFVEGAHSLIRPFCHLYRWNALITCGSLWFCQASDQFFIFAFSTRVLFGF